MSGSTARPSVTSRSRPGMIAALRAELRRISRRRPRWGYRRAHQLLLDEGWELNRKRTQRLWREEGLRVPQRRRKRQRLGDSTVPAERLRAERPDHVWALDFQFDQTADGHNLKLLHVVDEFTREALAIECRRRIDADHTVDGARPARRRARDRAGVHPLRQRAGADRQRAARLVPVLAGPGARTSSPARRGRTRTSRASAPASATSCSPSSCSPASPRRRCSSRTGARTTTSTGRTARSG